MIFFGDNITNLITNFIIFKKTKTKTKNRSSNEKNNPCMRVVSVIACNCPLTIEYMYNHTCANAWHAKVHNK